ncbi:MAG: methanogenesis marker protein Mmp4/MtxX [Candidatus Nezhaarchaeales archaeon]
MLSPIIPLRANWLRERLLREATKRRVTVAIGMGLEREDYPEKVLRESRRAVELGLANVKIVGSEEAVSRVSKRGNVIETIATREPESTIVEMLARGEVEAVVRGTLSANKTLKELKRVFKLRRVHRVAILETPDRTVFLLAPVGVDEGNDVEDKIELVKGGVRLLRAFGVRPIVAVLSGGRLEDYGRDAMVDEMLRQAEEVVNRVKREYGVEAYHQGILIEDAVKRATLIIAPNGVIGNMIFRVLTLVGRGGAFGAPVTDLLPKVFVDVSRAMESYTDSILLSAALANLTLPF